MRIDVAFTPSEVQALAEKVCIVVDVIRSTSTLTVIFSKSPGEVILTPTVQKAQRFADQQRVHPLLCGERYGVAPPGFDHGNSPREYLHLDLEGRTIIFTSSNGTRALADVNISPHVFLGCFLNGSAVVEKALSHARAEKLDILVVCAGREERFAVDDAYCAGYLISLMTSRIPPEESFTLGDGGQGALGIYGYFRDPLKIMEKSGAGAAITDRGLGDDIPFLLQKDLFDVVPTLCKRDRTPQAALVRGRREMSSEASAGFSLLL